jgi:hypothetical protein
MPDVKISALPAATVPLAGTEVLPIVQSATTRQVSVANLTAGRSVGGTNFIPSGSSVPTNGLYLPAANSLGFSTNSTNVATIDASGNLGLGVTPSAWVNAKKTFQASNAGFVGQTDRVEIWSNGYYDGTDSKYISTGFATLFQSVSGAFNFLTAASGTAGNAITFTQAMTLNASGNLGIGTSSPSALAANYTTVDIRGSSGGALRFGNTTDSAYIYSDSSETNIATATNQRMIFSINTAEKMRLDTSGIVTMSAYGAGAATFDASGVISSVSDETWKTKDGVPTNTDAMLQKLEPGYWFYNEEKTPTFGQERQLGFYAQNVHEAIGEEAAPTPQEGKPWGYYDRSVLAIAVMSLKNALNTIEELKQRITALENK